MPIRFWFLLVANLFLVGLGVVGFVTISLVDHASDIFAEAAEESTGHVQMSEQIRANLPDLRSLELEYIMTRTWQPETVLLEKMQTRRQSLRTVMTHYEKNGRDRSDPDCAACHNVFSQYLHSHDQMMALSDEGRSNDALLLYQDSASQYTSLLSEADRFRVAQYADAREDTRRGEATGQRARNILIAAFAGAALLTFVLGHSFSVYVSRRLGGLMEGTRRVMRGELRRPIEVRGHDEFTELSRAFNTMTRSLDAAQSENARLHEAAIQLREERIALLSDGLKRATEAQENERKRVSRELHDGVGQALTALQLGLGRLAKMTRSPAVKESATSLKDLTVDTLKEVRNLALDLRPSVLDQIGLPGTLSGYTKTLSMRTGIPIEFAANGAHGRLPPELEITIFRIAQEALANTAKYAHAKHASVELGLEDGTLRLVVEDDGDGFDVQAARADLRHHLGLSGMEERCRFSDGTFNIESVPGKGTKVTCTWQVAPPAANAAPGEASSPTVRGAAFALATSGGQT